MFLKGYFINKSRFFIAYNYEHVREYVFIITHEPIIAIRYCNSGSTESIRFQRKLYQNLVISRYAKYYDKIRLSIIHMMFLI